MKRNVSLWTALVGGALCMGCVDQRYIITSDPPHAMVLRNGVQIGPTPVDDHFVYYGKYHFTLIKDGYETLQVDQDIPAPFYEYPLLDFVSEALAPVHLHDVHAFNYQLREAQPTGQDELVKRGQDLRNRGRVLVGQNPPAAPPPPALAPAGPQAPPLGPPLPIAADKP
jgi:hypothetical protein